MRAQRLKSIFLYIGFEKTTCVHIGQCFLSDLLKLDKLFFFGKVTKVDLSLFK